MKRRASSRVRVLAAVFLAATAASLGACRQDEDPEGGRILWEKIHAAPDFTTWARAPGYATRQPSFTAHARQVDIFINPHVVEALKAPATTWPVGSIIVKEGHDGDARKLVAVMEKRQDGWFWAEYDDEGVALFTGRPSTCLDCHENRASYSDWVYAFELPR